MIKKKLNILLVLIAGLVHSLSSCTDSYLMPPTERDESVALVINYSTAGLSTRVTQESGWSDWGENRITRLDLLIFSNDGNTLKKHITKTVDTGSATDAAPGELALKESDLQGVTLEGGEQENGKTGDKLYLIANCEAMSGFTGTTISAFEAFKTSVLSSPFALPDTQTFVMDGYARLLQSNSVGGMFTETFRLRRAVAKIRVSFSAENDAYSPDLSNVSGRLMHYGSTAFVREQSKVTGDVADSEEATCTPYEDRYIVFYSYPNDWHDAAKFKGSGDSWTITDYYKAEPVVEAKKTYLVLKLPYSDGRSYYYKIPVNTQVYEGNDQKTFTQAEVDRIKAYYCLKRNTIYDVVVTLDRAGGTEAAPAEAKAVVRVTEGGSE